MSLCAHMHAGVCRDQERALGNVELKLQIVMSCHVDARNQTWDILQEQNVLLTAEPRGVFIGCLLDDFRLLGSKSLSVLVC